VGEGETAVLGETPIRGSGIRGTSVTGSMEKTTYEAWICSFADVGSVDTGIAIIIYYDNPLQKNALYEILDTLKFVQR